MTWLGGQWSLWIHALRILVSQRHRLMKSSLSVAWQECPRSRRRCKSSSERHLTEASTPMKPLPSVQQFRVPFWQVMWKTYFSLMLLHCLLVLKLWEVSSPDSFIEIQQFQPRSLRSSPQLLIIRPRSASQFFKVKERWLLTTRNSVISSSKASQWHQEVIHKLRLHLILMQMVFWMWMRKINQLARLNQSQSNQVVDSVIPTLKEWFRMLKQAKNKIREEERLLILKMRLIKQSIIQKSNYRNMAQRSLKM